jgi:hypothetical protein
VPAGSAVPEDRYEFSTVFDPVRSQVVLFGGYGYSTGYLNDTWYLGTAAGSGWSQPAVTLVPGPRKGQAAAYDAAGDRMIIVGGGPNRDTWELDLAAGPQWKVFHTLPDARRDAG